MNNSVLSQDFLIWRFIDLILLKTLIQVLFIHPIQLVLPGGLRPLRCSLKTPFKEKYFRWNFVNFVIVIEQFDAFIGLKID